MSYSKEPLTEKMREALRRAADPTGGVAGSDQYFAESLGGRGSVKALVARGFLRRMSDHPGSLCRITSRGKQENARAAGP